MNRQASFSQASIDVPQEREVDLCQRELECDAFRRQGRHSGKGSTLFTGRT